MARLILGGTVNLQVPPNLSQDAYGFYLFAGINDWGGISPVTRDFINPEMAWPQIDGASVGNARSRIRAARAIGRLSGISA